MKSKPDLRDLKRLATVPALQRGSGRSAPPYNIAFDVLNVCVWCVIRLDNIVFDVVLNVVCVAPSDHNCL